MKKAGSFFITLGLLLMAAAFGLVLHNQVEAKEAGRNAERVLVELSDVMREQSESDILAEDFSAPVEADKTVPVMATETIDGNRYIGVIEIPAQGISLPVGENWTEELLQLSPCRYSGSYYTDDLVICGHNFASHFSPIKYIEPEEQVYFVTVEGTRYSYSVVLRDTIQPDEVDKMLGKEDVPWDLTLFTCNNGGESRCAVRCIRVDTE